MGIADQERRYWDREKEVAVGSQIKAAVAQLKMGCEIDRTIDYDDHFELVVRRKGNAPQDKR